LRGIRGRTTSRRGLTGYELRFIPSFDWSDLEFLGAAFKQFHACDDGGIAEGWDDFVARVLARHWNELGELQKLAAVDTGFRAFVIRLSAILLTATISTRRE
jgi:hypothetical protein